MFVVSPSSVVPTRHIVLLQSLHNAPLRALNAAADLPPETEDWRPAEGEWAFREVIAHLAAAEPLFLARLKRILTEDNPYLPYFGPDTARPEPRAPLPDLLAEFQARRQELLDFLSKLSPADWDRPATHETLGPTTLVEQIVNLVNHDSDHLSQLRQLREAWERPAHD